MRFIIAALLCLLCQTSYGLDTALQDSLLGLLARTTAPEHKAQLYRNLADVYFDTPQERNFLKLLVFEAKKNNNQALLLDGLGDLAYSYIKAGKMDSVKIQLETMKELPSNDATNSWITYLNMRSFEAEVIKKNSSAAIAEEMKRQAATSDKEKSIYTKIEYAYNVTNGLEAQKRYSDALKYIETAVNLASTLPRKEGGLLYLATMRLKQRILRLDGQFDAFTPFIEKQIKIQEEYYEQYLKESRPFYPIDAIRIMDYSVLIVNIRKLTPEQASFYMQKVMELGSKTNRPKDKYYYFLCINNYYLFKRDYPKALTANDSLITYAPVVAPYLMPHLYNINSLIYEQMGRYKEALRDLRTSHTLSDSITSTESSEQLNELQVQYDLKKLNYEKSQLEIESKQNMLIFLSIILFIAVFICIYLYRSLKKEKAMKTRMRLLKTKAEESEKMKTVFINSICHEIRTPLNAIVGFTDLIFNESIDKEIRITFPEEIQKNTHQLTGLISSMLEVSNLDVSDEKLPCEPTDIHAICHREMDRIKFSGKAEINFRLDIPEKPLMITTHDQYLSLVIENLLNNANKFTTSGEVTLSYQKNEASSCLQISVTDTGSGIPPEKREEVFERFTKLNTFIPGNGLGLYLCRLIIRRLSGKIIIDPEYTGGTRILISLPI